MKIKTLIIFTSFVLILNSCASMKMHHQHQKQYFPRQIKQLFLGMPLHKFEKIKDVQKMEIYSGFDFRTEYTEIFSEGDIEEITYYFTKGESEILFEFIIKYKPDFNLSGFCRQTYGEHNAGDEWLFESKADFNIMIWTYETKLVIAGTLTGSGWE